MAAPTGTLTVRLDVETLSYIDVCARREGKGRTVWVRGILTEAIRRQINKEARKRDRQEAGRRAVEGAG